jgi:tetratricopeptide (TPR) repeat protein
MKQFAEGKIAEAAKSFRSAHSEEPRAWVRREILAELIRCELRAGDVVSAVSAFEGLIKSDRTTRHFHLIPLCWTDEKPSPEYSSAALVWRRSDNAAIRLVGASALLETESYRKDALDLMKRLAVDRDRRIPLLAEAQLWRSRLSQGPITAHDVSRWQRRIDGMPEELRGGPYFVLGRAQQQRNQHEAAARSYLWLPLVYSDNHFLAGLACLKSAEALARIGQINEALTLYREAAARFADTPHAAHARTAIEKATADSSTPQATQETQSPLPEIQSEVP